MVTNVGCIGDLLVEIMRQNIDDTLDQPGIFLGPYPSGASGIFINAISRLGIKSSFIGAVGNDDFGKMILRRLKKNNVDISYTKIVDDYTTGVAFVTYFNDGSRKFIYHLSRAATGQIFPKDLEDNYISNFDYLHIVGSTMSVNKQCRKSIEKAIDIVEYSGGRVTFDPNFRGELLKNSTYKKLFKTIISKSHIVFSAEEEIKILTGENDLKKAVKIMLDSGPEIIAIKQAKKGSTIHTKDENFFAPAYEVEEVDPTGAGDCYCAGFLTGIIEGMKIRETAAFANAVGALAVTKKGPMEGSPSRKEVTKFMEERPQIIKQII